MRKFRLLGGAGVIAVVAAALVVAQSISASSNATQPLKGKRIGVSMCCRVGILDFFVLNIKNAAKFTKRGESITVVNAAGDPLKQLKDVETFIAQGFNAVMTTEQSDAGWADLVVKAHKRGVIFANHSAPPNKGADVNIVYPHFQSGFINGADAGRWLKRTQGGSGETGISITTDNVGLLQRSKGFEAGLKSVIPGIKIWEAAANKGDDADGARVGGALLAAHPDIKIFFGWNEPVALGMLQAAAEAGRTDPNSFYVGTPDATPTAFQKVLDGTPMQAVGGPNFAFSTTLWLFLTERALLGQKIPKTALINVQLVTKANAARAKAQQTRPLDARYRKDLFNGLKLYWQPTTSLLQLPKGPGIKNYWGNPPKP